MRAETAVIDRGYNCARLKRCIRPKLPLDFREGVFYIFQRKSKALTTSSEIKFSHQSRATIKGVIGD